MENGSKKLFHFYALRLFSIIYEFNKAGLITLNATFKLQHHVILSWRDWKGGGGGGAGAKKAGCFRQQLFKYVTWKNKRKYL